MSKRPPYEWQAFVNNATMLAMINGAQAAKLLLKTLKNDQYDSASVWAWSITKHLEELRQGVLQGYALTPSPTYRHRLTNIVADIVNTTLIYDIAFAGDPYKALYPAGFKALLDSRGAEYFIDKLQNSTYWVGITLLDDSPTDDAVIKLIAKYMGQEGEPNND